MRKALYSNPGFWSRFAAIVHPHSPLMQPEGCAEVPKPFLKVRFFPKLVFVPRLPLWTRSAGLAACYMPREHCQFPMSIWFAYRDRDLQSPQDWVAIFAHEYGHFLLDWATTLFPFRVRERVQHKYDALCERLGGVLGSLG